MSYFTKIRHHNSELNIFSSTNNWPKLNLPVTVKSHSSYLLCWKASALLQKDAAFLCRWSSAVSNSSVHSYCTFEQTLLGLSVTMTSEFKLPTWSSACIIVPDRPNGPANISERFSMQNLHPGVAAGAHASALSSPLAFFSSDTFATLPLFSPLSLFFFLLVYDTYLLFISYTCHPLPAAAALPGWSGPLNWCLPAAEIVSPSQAGATQTLHPHE